MRALYDRWSGVYDWNPVLNLVRPARRRAVERMQLARGDVVVDMGTGTGANLPYLREAVGPEGEVVGMDVSPGMLRRARERANAERWSNVTLLKGDIRDPPIDGPVDGVISAFVVMMYAEPRELVETWASCIEDGAMANLYAGRSARLSAPVVNRLLSLYLRAFEEGWGPSGQKSGPLDLLVDRGEDVRTAMAARSERVRHEDFVFGLAHLDVGFVS